MTDFGGFRWKEAAAIVAAFAAVMGFVLMVWMEESRSMRKRIRALETTQAQIWCAMNFETCMGDRDAP